MPPGADTAIRPPPTRSRAWRFRAATERRTTNVSLSGLAAWVHSEPLESTSGGGDVYYLSVCNAGLLSRVALADVSGHGPDVG